MFKRVLVKISGEELAGKCSEHFDDATVQKIVTETQEVMRRGVEVSFVVGGGNFWRGRDARPDMDKTRAHHIGMMGTIMNGIYLSEAFRIAGMPSAVMTPFDVNGFTLRYSKDLALERIHRGDAVIFAGGTGHPFLSTDSIAAIRSCELSVDALLYAKRIDGVYDSDPEKNRNAKKYKTLSYETVMRNSLQVADISAIDLTAKAEKEIVSLVFGLSVPGSICTACMDNDELFAIGGTRIEKQIEEELYVQ